MVFQIENAVKSVCLNGYKWDSIWMKNIYQECSTSCIYLTKKKLLFGWAQTCNFTNYFMSVRLKRINFSMQSILWVITEFSLKIITRLGGLNITEIFTINSSENFSFQLGTPMQHFLRLQQQPTNFNKMQTL